MSALPVLYSFRRCPYAMRARLALAVSGQVCELREVVLRNKPQGLLQASPKATVPVLVLPGGQVLDQSLAIMRWALERHDPGRWLHPSHGALADMLALIAECDGPFKHALDRCKYPNRYPEADTALASTQAAQWLQGLDERLGEHDFLFGRHATLSDMAIAPFVRQFAGINAPLVGCPALAASAGVAGAVAGEPLVRERDAQAACVGGWHGGGPVSAPCSDFGCRW